MASNLQISSKNNLFCSSFTANFTLYFDYTYNGLRDSEGMSIRDEAKDILGHELVGHAIPRMVGSDTGNAVDNENKIRRELNNGENQQRAKESWHNE